MSASVCAGLHFPPGVEVSHAYDTGAHWKMMYSMAIRFMIMNIPETTYKLYVYFLLPAAIRVNIQEMLSLMGMMAAQ